MLYRRIAASYAELREKKTAAKRIKLEKMKG
jgi:hypothetical protein